MTNETLMQIFKFSEADAKKLRRIVAQAKREDDPKATDHALDKINDLVGGYGVEAIEGNWHDRYYQNIVALYVNRGDTYVTTMLYDTVRGTWHVSSWGDFVEHYERKYGIG